MYPYQGMCAIFVCCVRVLCPCAVPVCCVSVLCMCAVHVCSVGHRSTCTLTKVCVLCMCAVYVCCVRGGPSQFMCPYQGNPMPAHACSRYASPHRAPPHRVSHLIDRKPHGRDVFRRRRAVNPALPYNGFDIILLMTRLRRLLQLNLRQRVCSVQYHLGRSTEMGEGGGGEGGSPDPYACGCSPTVTDEQTVTTSIVA